MYDILQTSISMLIFCFHFTVIPNDPTDKNSALVQVLVWCQTGTKPLYQSMTTQFAHMSLSFRESNEANDHSTIMSLQHPRQQSSWGQHGCHLGPVGPRWAPCWPHEPCYQGSLPNWSYPAQSYHWADMTAMTPFVLRFTGRLQVSNSS